MLPTFPRSSRSVLNPQSAGDAQRNRQPPKATKVKKKAVEKIPPESPNQALEEPRGRLLQLRTFVILRALRGSCSRLSPIPPLSWTRTHKGPYNEKNQSFGRTPPSAARTEANPQFAPNRFPHEGQLAATGAQTPRALGTDRHLRAHSGNTQGSRLSPVHPARWSALRQWRPPHGTRPQ